VSIGGYLPDRHWHVGLLENLQTITGRYAPPGRSTGFKHCSGAVLDLLVVWTANLAGLRVLTVVWVCHLLNAVAAGNNPDWWYLAT
jgi:hypothetical protein